MRAGASSKIGTEAAHKSAIVDWAGQNTVVPFYAQAKPSTDVQTALRDTFKAHMEKCT